MNAGYYTPVDIVIAHNFQKLKPTRLLVTGLDLVRRLECLLALSNTCDLPFCDVSPSPAVADGLHPINPVSLAGLLIPRTDQTEPRGDSAEATMTI